MAQPPGRGGNIYDVLAQPLQGNPLGCVLPLRLACTTQRDPLVVSSNPSTRASARPQHPSPAALHPLVLNPTPDALCAPCSPFNPRLKRDQLLPLLAEAASADADGRYRDAARYVTSVGAWHCSRPNRRAWRRCASCRAQRATTLSLSSHCAAPHTPPARADHACTRVPQAQGCCSASRTGPRLRSGTSNTGCVRSSAVVLCFFLDAAALPTLTRPAWHCFPRSAVPGAPVGHVPAGRTGGLPAGGHRHAVLHRRRRRLLLAGHGGGTHWAAA